MEKIRRLTPQDHPALAALLAQLGYPVSPEDLPGRLQRFGELASGRVLVAEADGAVVAFAAWEVTHPIHHATPVAHLSSFAVLDSSRRRGIGRRLLSACEEAARAAGCALVVLTSANGREDAHAFYPSSGYETTGLRFAKRLVPTQT